ncbi:hypothetical protein ACSSS7_000407 [Eimeria intestinalis]
MARQGLLPVQPPCGAAQETATAAAARAPASTEATAAEPPLSTCLLYVGRRYVLVVGSTGKLQQQQQQQQIQRHQRRPQQQQQRKTILQPDGKGWRRLHSLLLIHKQPTLQQRQHLQEYWLLHQRSSSRTSSSTSSSTNSSSSSRHQRQGLANDPCFGRPPTWERIGSRLMSTAEAERHLRETLQQLREEPQQQILASGLLGFLPLVCGYHLVFALGAQPYRQHCLNGERAAARQRSQALIAQAAAAAAAAATAAAAAAAGGLCVQVARLLLRHTIYAVGEIQLLPLFFHAKSLREVAPYCCSKAPTLHLLWAVWQQQQQQQQRQQQEQQQQPQQDQRCQQVQEQEQQAFLNQVQHLCDAVSASSLDAAAAAAAAAAEDARYSAAVSAYRSDRGFYFCRTLCINLSLQQLAARRPAAAAAAAAAAAVSAATGDAAEVEAAAAAAAAEAAAFQGRFLSCEACPSSPCVCKTQQHQQQQQQQQQEQQPQLQQEQNEGSSRWRRSPLSREECRFLWNRELLSLLLQRQQQQLIAEGFFVLLLHGAVQQQVLHAQGAQLQLLTLSRRSTAFAGPRYRKRGLNDAGDAANEIEVEFICLATMPSRAAAAAAAAATAAAAAAASGQQVEAAERLGGCLSAVASHVVSRGSAPVMWCQDTAVLPAKPRIRHRITDVNCSATRRHMASLLQRYGAPLLLLNLLRNSGAPHRMRFQQPGTAAALAAAASAARRLTKLSPQAQKQHLKEWRSKDAGAAGNSEAATDGMVAASTKPAASIQPLAAAAAAGPAAAEANSAPVAASSAAAEGDESPCDEAAAATTAEQEGSLGEFYQRTVELLNEELPVAVRLRFAGVDVEAERRADARGASERVQAVAGQALDELRFFASDDVWTLQPVQLQSGVCRLNCLDSLDRTNELQLHVHRAFVLRFLKMLPAAFVIDPALDEAVLRAVAFLTDATGDDVALQYGGSVAHRKRLVPLAWASQLPLRSPAAVDPHLAWGASRPPRDSTASSSGTTSEAPPGAATGGPAAAHSSAATPPPSVSSSSNNNSCSSSDKTSSSLLTALQQLPGSVAARWLWATRTTGAPLLPGLSTSLQRSGPNSSSSSSKSSSNSRSSSSKSSNSSSSGSSDSHSSSSSNSDSNSSIRMYANILEDGRKQQSLNLWFGLYRPLARGVLRQPPLWKLDDAYDVYVHHSFLEPSFSPKDWWVLPLQRFFNSMRAAVSTSSWCICRNAWPAASAAAAGPAAAAAAARRAGRAAAAAGAAASDAAAAAAGAAGVDGRRLYCGCYFTAEKTCFARLDFSACLSCCQGPTVQPFIATPAKAAAAAATSETGGMETTEALLRCLGAAAWVSDFLPPSCVCTAAGDHCCDCSPLWTAESSPARGPNTQQFLQTFTYIPWRREAAAAAAAAAAGASAVGPAAAASHTTTAGGPHDREMQDSSQASSNAATTCMRPSSSPDDNKSSRSRCSSGSSSGSSSSTMSGTHSLTHLCADCDGMSLALLLPALLDPAAAAARALSCCCARELREKEQKGRYTTLQQQQQQQEEDERIGASSMACWAPPLVLLQQRSSGSPWQQRLLQAHRALRFGVSRGSVNRNPCLLNASATARQAGIPACRTGSSEAAAARGAVPPLLLASSTSTKPRQQKQQQHQQQQHRESEEQMWAAAAVFKSVLKEHLQHHTESVQQQQLLQHRRALAHLPSELQRALRQQLASCAVAAKALHVEPSTSATSSSSRSSTPCCWELAAKGGLQQQAVELYVQQEDTHRARLLQQRRELTTTLLQSPFGL